MKEIQETSMASVVYPDSAPHLPAGCTIEASGLNRRCSPHAAVGEAQSSEPVTGVSDGMLVPHEGPDDEHGSTLEPFPAGYGVSNSASDSQDLWLFNQVQLDRILFDMKMLLTIQTKYLPIQ